MLDWLRRRFRNPSPSAAEPAPVVDSRWAETRRWLLALEGLSVRDAAAWSEQRARLTEWYDHHPLEVVWGRDYRFRVADPLALTTDDLVRDDDVATLVPWARLLRSLVIVTGGPNLLHHGCGVTTVVDLLRDPSAPDELVNLSLPHLVVDRLSDVDELVEVLCTSERTRSLEHLQFSSGLPLRGRHVERLAEAPWAASLRTLDLTEAMVDWSVDFDEAERHAAYRALGKLRSVTHLFMYNDFGEVGDLEVFLEATFPALTHLNLGGPPKEPEVLDLLARTASLPGLQELCLADGPPGGPQWDRMLEVAFEVYLHGTRVTATYPKRTA